MHSQKGLELGADFAQDFTARQAHRHRLLQLALVDCNTQNLKHSSRLLYFSKTHTNNKQNNMTEATSIILLKPFQCQTFIIQIEICQTFSLTTDRKKTVHPLQPQG
jgi:hypothetical protein